MFTIAFQSGWKYYLASGSFKYSNTEAGEAGQWFRALSFPTAPVQSPAPTEWFTTTCNPSPRESDIFFWPLWAPGLPVMLRHNTGKLPIHIKSNKLKLHTLRLQYSLVLVNCSRHMYMYSIYLNKRSKVNEPSSHMLNFSSIKNKIQKSQGLLSRPSPSLCFSCWFNRNTFHQGYPWPTASGHWLGPR